MMVNEGLSSLFRSTRGLRQGDPLFPLLFIVVMEALCKLIEKAKEVDLLRGIQVAREGNQIEISHLFFADDTFIFSQQKVIMMMLDVFYYAFRPSLS